MRAPFWPNTFVNAQPWGDIDANVTSPHLWSLLVRRGGCPAETLPARAQAPQQLDNKTIEISWTSSVAETDGQNFNRSFAVSHIIYVSSAGRLFERGMRSRGQKRKQRDDAPGSTHNAGGEANNVHFEGNS